MNTQPPYDARTGFVCGGTWLPRLPAGDSWEERMAQRAAARRGVADMEAMLAQLAELDMRVSRLGPMHWLDGFWHYVGGAEITLGTDVCCVACGDCLGVECVVVDPDWMPPDREPDWPYTSMDCPLCPVRPE